MENQTPNPTPPNQTSPTISTLDAVLVIIVTFFLAIILGTVFFFTIGDGPALVIGELVILIVPLTYLLVRRINIKNFIGINLKPKFILLGLALGAALLILNIIVSATLTTMFGTSQAIEESTNLLTNLSTSTSGLIAVVASLALAGVCEEFAFRGFLQNALTRRYSFIPALIVSSAVFGFFHFDTQLTYSVAAMAIGLVLGYINYRWNYVACATAHSTMNLIVLALLLLGL